MKIFRQLGIILLILFVGELISRFTGIPVPGNVMGMIILLISLRVGWIKLEMIDGITKFLLDHLAFFFIPAGVGLIKSLDLIQREWFPIVSITMVSTAMVMVVTGSTVQFLKRRGL